MYEVKVNEELMQRAREVTAWILERLLGELELPAFREYYHGNKERLCKLAPGPARMGSTVTRYAKRQAGERLGQGIDVPLDVACRLIDNILAKPANQPRIQETLQRAHPDIYDELTRG